MTWGRDFARAFRMTDAHRPMATTKSGFGMLFGGRQRTLPGALKWLVVLGVVGCTNEPKLLPPRSAPAHVAPPIRVPDAPVPEGFGRVVLHGTDGPMRVSVRADESFIPPGMSVPPTRSGELCVTPCVVDLPAGRYKLFLVSADGSVPGGDVDALEVHQSRLNYYVRAPGRSEPRTWLPALPFALTLVGTVALAGGLVLLSADNDSTRTTGVALLAGGAVTVTVGGIFYYDASRGTQQEGATTSWQE
jgi:hypothetical protein